MALLDKVRNRGGGGGAGGDGPTGDGGFDPDKAKKFFDHARTAHDTGRFEYAMQLWLGGLKQDPGNMDALQNFFASSTAYLEENPKGVGKEAKKALTVKKMSGLDKFAVAVLECGVRQLDPNLRIKAAELGAALGLADVSKYLADTGFRLALVEKKPRKDHFTKLRAAYEKIGAFAEAVKAAQKASEIDPGDRELQDNLRNMMAQAAMSQGGFDNVHEEGGFRKNIRDSDKQDSLEAADRVVKTEDTKKRVLLDAYEQYKLRPQDIPTIRALIKALREMGTDEHNRNALKVSRKAYKDTQQFSFREMEGDIQLAIARAQLRDSRSSADADPDNEELRSELATQTRLFHDMEIQEMELRVKHYPTDLPRKLLLGEKLHAAQRYEDAIPHLQEAKDDARNRLKAMGLLAECFLKTDFAEGAEQTYRDALGRVEDDSSDQALELRYGLMCALQSKAEQNRDQDAASEAQDLAAAISIQKFNYRDVRERRDQIKSLAAELRG